MFRASKPVADRFWPKVDKSAGPDACWIWTASRTAFGYGRILVSPKYVTHAQRVAYELCIGPIPAGLIVRHKCDNPPCCNPAHLELGTNADNSRDMVARGRAATGSRNGVHTHPERQARGEQHWARRDPLRAARAIRGMDPALRPRGESHANAKLNEKIVLEIRALGRGGELTSRIAERFGISRSLVRNVLLGRGWKHVQEVA